MASYMLICENAQGVSFNGSSYNKGDVISTPTEALIVQALKEIGQDCAIYHTDDGESDAPAQLVSADAGAFPLDLAPDDAIDVAVEGESEDTAAFTAADKATVTAGNSPTYDIDDGQTLIVKVDDGDPQTALFETADFVDIDAATGAEIVAVLTSDIAGATSDLDGGDPRITSDTQGSGSRIEIVGGTAAAALGFEAGEVYGDVAEVVAGSSPDYDLEDGQTLIVKVDGRPAITITFLAEDVVDIDAVTGAEVVAIANPALDFATVDLDPAGDPRIRSNNFGVDAKVEVTGGTANAALGFSTSEVAGESNVANIDAVTAAEVKKVLQAALTSANGVHVIVNDDDKLAIQTVALGPAATIECVSGKQEAKFGITADAEQTGSTVAAEVPAKGGQEDRRIALKDALARQVARGAE